MIKIEFPADRKDIALAIGKALTEIGQGAVVPAAAVDSVTTATASDGPGASSTACDDQHAPDNDATTEEQAATESPNADSTSQAATQEQKAAGAHAAGDSENVDEKGVPFNGEFCSKAASPFYGSGKKKGQWKKRQGVDEAAYDGWYAEALAAVAAAEPEQEQATETTSDGNIAASMFAASDAQHAAAADENTPQDAGQLMKWVSEQQAAGNITQQQVTDAYTALQLPFDAVMNPAYPVADNCAAIYNHLKGQIG